MFSIQQNSPSARHELGQAVGDQPNLIHPESVAVQDVAGGPNTRLLSNFHAPSALSASHKVSSRSSYQPLTRMRKQAQQAACISVAWGQARI